MPLTLFSGATLFYRLSHSTFMPPESFKCPSESNCSSRDFRRRGFAFDEADQHGVSF